MDPRDASVQRNGAEKVNMKLIINCCIKNLFSECFQYICQKPNGNRRKRIKTHTFTDTHAHTLSRDEKANIDFRVFVVFTLGSDFNV